MDDVVVLSQQFGNLTVDVVKIDAKVGLLVPSSKSLDPNIPPVVPGPNPHFLCYDLDNVRAGIPDPVLVRDQFNPVPDPPQTVTFTNKKNWRLCARVNKNGEDLPAETSSDGLFCYVTGPDIDSPLAGGVTAFWANQISSDHDSLDKLDDFCVSVTFSKP